MADCFTRRASKVPVCVLLGIAIGACLPLVYQHARRIQISVAPADGAPIAITSGSTTAATPAATPAAERGAGLPLSKSPEGAPGHRYPTNEVRFWENEAAPPTLTVGADNAALVEDDVKADEMKTLVDSEIRTGYKSLKDRRIWGLDTYSGRLEALDSDSVFNVVHFLWCEKKTFEFQHYLSVRSTIKYLAPDLMFFHYTNYPRHDKDYYNTWFEDMKHEFPFIDLDDLSARQEVCNSTEAKESFIAGVLDTEGGIYVHSNTIFTSPFPAQYRKADVTYALSENAEGFVVAKKGALSGKWEALRSAPPDGKTRNETRCVPADSYKDAEDVVCAIRKGPYFPRVAWDKDDPFSKAVNRIMYGQDQPPKAQPSYRELIPNIGHVLWLAGKKMPFLFYLNCLSQLYILKVDRLYVHGDKPPSGPYWNLIRNHERVTYVRRTWPKLVFRNKVGVWNHMSDVFRADIMIHYGGIYTDTDAVWINPIPDSLRLYDAVASYDWPIMYSAYPDYLQLGVSMGRRNAKFWHLFQRSMVDFKDDMFGYNGLLKPYKVFERRPDLVHVYDKLQVMCWELLCHPTWYADFRNADSSHLKYPDFNWTLAHSFHWTSPTPVELHNETSLRQGSGVFADIGRHILKQAGLLN